jgi:DNA polymerase III epsilon subunit-like protein
VSMLKRDRRGESFVAIDFETANARRASPCAVGWVIIEGDRVTDSGSSLIAPPTPGFDGFNVRLHGITAAMCRDAPSWPEALKRITDVVDNRTVVAHNASFDMSVLRDSCLVTGLPVPPFRFLCSMAVGRYVWPDLGAYTLTDVAAAAGLRPFNHHDCREDARAAGEIVAVAVRTVHASSLADLMRALGMNGSELRPGTPTNPMPRHWSTGGIPRLPSPGSTADPEHPFYGKKIVFTGDLVSMDRRAAQQTVVDHGGKPMSTLSRFTDFLVVGGEFHGLLDGHPSHKLERFHELNSAGSKIEALNEHDFLAMLGSAR